MEKDLALKNQIINDLRKIINELYSLADEIEGNFEDVGQKYCANSLRSLAYKYKMEMAKIQKIKVTSANEFMPNGAGQGRGGFR